MKLEFFNQSHPIWATGLETEKNITLGLRGVFDATEDNKVLIHIATSGIYRVFVNGNFVNYGPARGPHDYYRVDQLDISEHVRHGRNIIAIEVACYNINSFYLLDQPAFIQAEVYVDNNTVLATSLGKNFNVKIIKERTQKVQRYSYQRTFVEAYKLTEDYDCWRNDLSVPMEQVEVSITDSKKFMERRVSYPTFNIMQPEKVMSVGNISRCKKDTYWEDRSMQVSEIIKGFKIEELEAFLSHEIEELTSIENKTLDKKLADVMPIHLEDNTYSLCKFEYNNTGFIGINVECKEDTVIYLTFDEIYSEEDKDIDFTRMSCVNAIKYYLKKGTYTLETMEPYTLQYLKIMVTKGCSITGIYIKEYVNPNTDIANFTCNNDNINKIYKAGKETYKQNALDIFMDCPSRERTGFLCDSYFTGRVEYDLTGRSRIEKNFLENYIIPQSFKFLPDGILPMCYPADHNAGQFIPNWALWFVIELEEYFERSKDAKLLADAKESVYRIFKYFETFKNSDGLLEKLENWIFVEWSRCNDFVQDVNYPTNMLYSAALIVAGNLYDDNKLIEEGKRIKEVIRQQSYNGEFFVDNALRENSKIHVTNNVTETCQYYAFFFNIATKELYPDLYEALLNQLGPKRKDEALSYVYPSNAFIGNYLRLEILSRNGEHVKVMEELEDYFLYMAEITGTLWENIGTSASCNHGFASHVIRFIYRDGAGIRQVDKNTKSIVIDTDNIVHDAYEITLVIEDKPVYIQYDKDKFIINSQVKYQLKDLRGNIISE